VPAKPVPILTIEDVGAEFQTVESVGAAPVPFSSKYCVPVDVFNIGVLEYLFTMTL
jgi:hypothetical protein